MEPFGLGVIIIICIIIFCVIDSNYHLVIRRYTYSSSKLPKSFEGVKILHLSDLHSKRFGKNNIKLVQKVDKLKPDYIVMTGDMIHKNEKNIEQFVKELQPILKKYPVFYSIGNHERRMGYKKYNEYIEKLQACGVHVLSDSSYDIEREYEKIHIVGLNFKDNIRYEKMDQEKIDKKLDYLMYQGGPIDETKFNILLAHDALNFPLYKRLGYDLVFAGHVHGGLIRLGKIGLLSPRRTFFPKYCFGKYVLEDSTMFVSTGMGDASIPLRLFNPPEMSLITLKKQEEGERHE